MLSSLFRHSTRRRSDSFRRKLNTQPEHPFSANHGQLLVETRELGNVYFVGLNTWSTRHRYFSIHLQLLAKSVVILEIEVSSSQRCCTIIFHHFIELQTLVDEISRFLEFLSFNPDIRRSIKWRAF